MPRCGKPVCLLLALAAVLAAGCNSGEEEDSGEVNLVLVAQPPALTVPPGAQGLVEFTLQDREGRPQANRTLRLTLIDENPEVGSGGASLITSQGTTDSQGRFVAIFGAGTPGVFGLRASNSRSESLTVTVTVASGSTRSAEAAPVAETGLAPATYEMRLYPGVPCSQLRANTPPVPDPALSQKLDISGRWVLPSLEMQQTYGLTAVGLNLSGAVIGFGCINVDGQTLLQSTRVTLWVPLKHLPPMLAPRYILASELAFLRDEMPRGANTLVDAWKRLSGCAHDPAQIWLDCTLDALANQDPVSDPLDCRPAPDEGALGQVVAARLGSIVNMGSECRGNKDVGGQPSLDAIVQALFPNPATSPVVAALPGVVADAKGLLGRIRLSTSLDIAYTGRPGVWQALHGIISVGFPVGDAFFNVSLADHPGRFARYVVATTDEAGVRLELGQHEFGLRLGHAARLAFLERALQQRMLPPDEAAFVNLLFGAARMPGGNLSGCAAFDAQVCSALGRPQGCLVAACNRGLEALAVRLRTGFNELNGEELDFSLEGSVTLDDRQEDGTFARLGGLLPTSAGPGLWTARLRTITGPSPMTGLWVGTRVPSP